ncbi:MAG: transglycosylase SLT domain-containing protein, partial [Candidatus Neomarinimicrobiota bacterium]
SFIPIPVIGTLIGELLGEYVGDLFYTGLMGGGMDAVGKKLQEDIKAVLQVGSAIKDWIGDGFSRINEGIPTTFGVKNYLVLFNPIESVPLFFKAFFTRDPMTEEKENSSDSSKSGDKKETKVEQKFLGGIVNAAKDFLGVADPGSVTSSGLVKEPKELPGMSLTKIPLKNNETYYALRVNNSITKAGDGLRNIFGNILGTGGGNTNTNSNSNNNVSSGPSTYSPASYKEDPEFEKEVNRLAQKYDIDASDLLGLMASESGLNPQARNKSGATGLIQFMPTTARSLGTSTAALYKMNRVQQMEYVEKYFDYWNLPKGATPGHLYTSVFLPAFTSKPADYIVAKRGGFTDSWGNHPSSWYTHNAGLDSNGDGSISIAELGARIQKKKAEFGITGGGSAPVIAKAPDTSQQAAPTPQISQRVAKKKEGESEYDTSKHGTPGGPKIGKGFNPGKGDTSRRIFLHWTAGDYSTPYSNYHTTFLGDGTPVRTTENYGINKSNHTGGANQGSVGLSIAAMASGKEHNFGSYPPKDAQLQAMALEAGSLAKAWGWSESTIDKNVMTHGEWERHATSTGKLPGSPQRWDLDKVFSAKEKIGAGGDYMRKLIKKYFKGITGGTVEPPVEGKTMESDPNGGQPTPSPQITSGSDSDSDSEESAFEFKKVYNSDGSLNFTKTFIHPDLQTGGTFGAALVKGSSNRGEENGGQGSSGRVMGSSTIGSAGKVMGSSTIGSAGKVMRSSTTGSSTGSVTGSAGRVMGSSTIGSSNNSILASINNLKNENSESSASFGTLNIKNYQIQESAHYDDSSSQVVLISPPTQQKSSPALTAQRKNYRKSTSNTMIPLLTDSLNSDITYILSKAALY